MTNKNEKVLYYCGLSGYKPNTEGLLSSSPYVKGSLTIERKYTPVINVRYSGIEKILLVAGKVVLAFDYFVEQWCNQNFDSRPNVSWEDWVEGAMVQMFPNYKPKPLFPYKEMFKTTPNVGSIGHTGFSRGLSTFPPRPFPEDVFDIEVKILTSF